MDSRTEDGRQAAKQSDNSDKRLVQGKPPPADAGTMGNAESENDRPLRILWDKSQFQEHKGVLLQSANSMAQMAEPTRQKRKPELEIVYGFHGGMAPTETEDNALISLSETLTRGTGCLNWARPGLWGFRAGDCPVLPG